MDIWKGTIVPLRKHYDHEHRDFYEHSMAAGAVLGFKTEDEEEYVDIFDYNEEEADEDELERIRQEAIKIRKYYFIRSPITGKQLKNAKLFYAITITLSGKNYDYYIPAPSGGLTPTTDQIRRALDGYIHNQDVDRKDISDFLADM